MNTDLAKTIFVLGLVAFAMVRLPGELRAWRIGRRTSSRPALERLLLAIATVGLVVVPMVYVVFGAPKWADRSTPAALCWLGAALFLAGQMVLLGAHRRLGRNFSSRLVIRHEHTLVKDGIYAYVRHPMYSGFWLWGLGQALLLPNWAAAFSGLIGFGVLYFLRLNAEERLMIDAFGDEYRAYMKRTARIVPRLRCQGRSESKNGPPIS